VSHVSFLPCPAAAATDSGIWAGQLAAHVVKQSPAGDVRAALAKFIQFSEKYGLGMHLGKEKGDLIEYAVGQGLPETGPAVIFEMGCHSGDGTLSAISALSERPGSTVISTEANKGWLEGAKRVVKHALEGHETTFLPFIFNDDEDLELLLETLRTKYGINQFDTVIFDHNEKLFLTHLKVIQARGFLKAGTTIYVDNVKRKGKVLRKYMEHVNTKSKRGYETEIKHVKKPYPDAVAISTWWGPTLTMEL